MKNIISSAKKSISTLAICFFITLACVGGFMINNSISCDEWIQWNGNPEGTNDGNLFSFEYFLTTGDFSEYQVYNRIVNYNYLTDDGVKTLINDGFLISYIDDLVAAGRLPQGFTRTPSESDIYKQVKAALAYENGTATTPDTNTGTGNTGNNAGSNNQGGSTTTTPTTNNNTTTVTVDESVSGTYIVIKAEAQTYNDYKASTKINTLILEEEVEVQGLTSNGFYIISKNDATLYVKKENLVSKLSYVAAWSETSRTDATCNTEGSVTYINDYTGITKTEVLAKVEHDFEIVEQKMPTCTENGYRNSICKLCKKETESNMAKLGHTEGEMKTVAKKGLFTNGRKEIRCLRCDKALKTETIPSTVPLIPILCVALAGIGAVAGVVVYKKKHKQAD